MIYQWVSTHYNRYYEWWKVHLIQGRHPHFCKAIALVVLVQVSSASVERVSSVLKGIVDACGNNLLADMLRFRMFVRVNKHLRGLLGH